MSRLQSFLDKLVDKKIAMDAEAEGGNGGGQSHAQSSVYGHKSYWDDRYEEGVIGDSQRRGELSNEWFVGYAAWREDLHEHAARGGAAVLLGIGLSLLGEDMVEDGYTDVLAVDFSEVCIERLQGEQARRTLERRRAAKAAGEGVPAPAAMARYEVMDVTALECGDGSVDACIDKATIDTLYNLEDGEAAVAKMLAECSRVLRGGGKYICLSYSGPEDRLEMLQQAGWGWELVEHKEVRKNKATFHLYVMQKGGGV